MCMVRWYAGTLVRWCAGALVVPKLLLTVTALTGNRLALSPLSVRCALNAKSLLSRLI